MVHEAPTGRPKRLPASLAGTHPTRPAGTHLPFGSQRDGHNPLLRPKCAWRSAMHGSARIIASEGDPGIGADASNPGGPAGQP